ncbi:MAG: DoxX family protein [Prevotellaceae bacterium]|jgi:uncharacterized membrane protein YphA (DoxX/SURF4 family)|nr:DoxX family protein [Prevotellaceae bacterium]
MKSIVANTARILFGIVFIFSGFVKAIDPLGFAYKIKEYIEPLGVEWFSYFALPVAVGLCALEFVIGACVLMGFKSRLMGLLSILFMAVMTPLTLYVAIFNPVTDCGCFGDALVIGNWETFYKNIVFSAFAIIIFVWHKEIKPVFKSEKLQFISAAFVTLTILAFSAYCLYYLPIIDFRPYKIGNNIIEKMSIPEGAPKDEFEPATFIYAKDGEEREFTLQSGDFPDSSWTFVRQGREQKLLKKGFEPAIRDFVIESAEMGEVTDWVTGNENYLFLLAVPFVEKASTRNYEEINRIFDFARENGYDFFAVTASGSEDIEAFRAKTGAAFEFFNADEKIIQAMIRANPGLILLKNGTVYGKWSHNRLPSFDKPLDQDRWATPDTRNDGTTVLWSALIFIIPLCVLKLFDKK